ncbi:MAG: hypothetical protein ACRDEA_00545 [Microcystaceae cyanobacterium]
MIYRLLKASATSVLAQSHDHHDVGRVLAQSDLAREWKAFLPQPEYQTRLVQYIQATYNRAQEQPQPELFKNGELESR